MTCEYCHRTRCIHRDPQDDQLTPVIKATLATQPPKAVAKRRSAAPLFQLVSLRDLECVLCRWVAPVGPYQTALRFTHGMGHVKEGDAIIVRRGLPPRLVSF